MKRAAPSGRDGDSLVQSKLQFGQKKSASPAKSAAAGAGAVVTGVATAVAAASVAGIAAAAAAASPARRSPQRAAASPRRAPGAAPADLPPAAADGAGGAAAPSSADMLAKFLVPFPEELRLFFECMRELNPADPRAALLTATGLQLVGPFDVLAGAASALASDEEFLCHWRFFYDAPEFVTLLADATDPAHAAPHFGYFRDHPTDTPAFVAEARGPTLLPCADNLFAAAVALLDRQLALGDWRLGGPHAAKAAAAKKPKAAGAAAGAARGPVSGAYAEHASYAGPRAVPADAQRAREALREHAARAGIAVSGDEQAAWKARAKRAHGTTFHGVGVVVPCE
jgi:hypothetical protein